MWYKYHVVEHYIHMSSTYIRNWVYVFKLNLTLQVGKVLRLRQKQTCILNNTFVYYSWICIHLVNLEHVS